MMLPGGIFQSTHRPHSRDGMVSRASMEHAPNMWIGLSCHFILDGLLSFELGCSERVSHNFMNL